MSMSRWPAVLLLLWCLAPMGATAAGAGAKGDDVPAGARAYLAELRAVADDEARSHPSSYGFSRPVGKIELGALHPVYTPSSLLLEEGASVESVDAFDAPGEWVAPVLEDGVPRNVIGMYEEADGQYGLSTFGYGEELAVGLDTMNGRSRLVYEAPMDAWYAVDGKMVTIIDAGNTQQQSRATVSWSVFADGSRDRHDAMMPDVVTSGATWRAGLTFCVAAALAVAAVRAAQFASRRRHRPAT